MAEYNAGNLVTRLLAAQGISTFRFRVFPGIMIRSAGPHLAIGKSSFQLSMRTDSRGFCIAP